MTDWKAIWERKGHEPTDDLRELNGYQSTTADFKVIARNIREELDLQSTDRVLEIGGGAGGLAQHLALHCDYTGIDASSSLVQRHRQLHPHATFHHMEANQLHFDSGAFDKVFIFSVCHYFGTTTYFEQARAEAIRVARHIVFIGDLPLSSHDDSHLLFRKDQFNDWQISLGYYNPDRFNARWQITPKTLPRSAA